MKPEEHCEKLIQFISQEIRRKYLAGQKEHGGELWLKDGLVLEAFKENIDGAIYTATEILKQRDINQVRGQVLLFDLDESLCKGKYFLPEEVMRAEPDQEVMQKINEKALTNFVIIYTARRNELIPATIDWLDKHNIKYHAISNKKIPGIYVDSMSVRPEEIE